MWQIIVSSSLYLCTLIGLVLYNKINPKYLRLLVLWFFVFALADITLYLFYESFPKGDLVKYIYIPLDPFHFIVYAHLLIISQRNSKFIRNIIFLVFVIFLIIAFFQLAFRLNIKSAATQIFTVKSILILIVILYYFGNLIISNKIIKISETPLFWVAAASLFYFTGNIIATGMYHYLTPESRHWAKLIYRLNYILEILVYIFSIYAFIIASKTKTEL